MNASPGGVLEPAPVGFEFMTYDESIVYAFAAAGRLSGFPPSLTQPVFDEIEQRVATRGMVIRLSAFTGMAMIALLLRPAWATE